MKKYRNKNKLKNIRTKYKSNNRRWTKTIFRLEDNKQEEYDLLKAILEKKKLDQEKKKPYRRNKKEDFKFRK